MGHDRPPVTAVVVTRDRRELLRRCLLALKSQTLPLSRIVVADNASSDGTADMLRAEFPDVSVISLPENIGGAGGFHEGMKAAMEGGAGWIWTMDDDCLPAPDALEKLAAAAEEGKVYGSAVLAEGGTGYFASGRVLLGAEGSREVSSIYELGGEAAVETLGVGFGGLFISRRTVELVGLPRKDFFVYGDDSEYSRRIRLAHGLRMYYVPASVITHPPLPVREVRFLWRRVKLVPSAPWKVYYSVRNQIYVARLYATSPAAFWLGTVPRQLLFLAFRALFIDGDSRAERLALYLAAVRDGVLGRLGRKEFKGV